MEKIKVVLLAGIFAATAFNAGLHYLEFRQVAQARANVKSILDEPAKLLRDLSKPFQDRSK